MPTEYYHLEQKIKELQAEVDRLKAKEKKSKLPENFNRDSVLKFLTDLHPGDLRSGFSWESTPQGYKYWNKIYYNTRGNSKIPDEAIIQLQKWVIMSYQQECGA